MRLGWLARAAFVFMGLAGGWAGNIRMFHVEHSLTILYVHICKSVRTGMRYVIDLAGPVLIRERAIFQAMVAVVQGTSLILRAGGFLLTLNRFARDLARDIQRFHHRANSGFD